MTRIVSAALVAAALAVAGCGEDGAGSGDAGGSDTRVAVVASFYPVEEAAREVGGDRVDVVNLTPPGGEPHDLEPTSDALVALERADVALYLGNGFQPNVERAVAALGDDGPLKADLLDGVELRRNDPAVPGVRGEIDEGELADRSDPHVWVDPVRFADMVRATERALAAADPAGAETYRRNAEGYVARLRDLDRDFATALGSCRSRTLVTSHAAFGYLADRYRLRQAPIAGISPEDEPDPKSLAATARLARADRVGTVFFETLVPPDLARVVADEIGAGTDALDPVEGLTADDASAGKTYLTIQRENLAAIAAGLECTRG